MDFCAGIDLGGTFIKYGLVAEDGRIIEKGKVPTPPGCGYAETLNAIASAVRGIAEKSGVRIRCACVGYPGVI